ncbi:MAG: carboxypeptidase regulatory-like domain-containing protein, partial [Candidatus Aminicenantes bacterium]|nr:carboxypeptidase regulatory-like domain-containing protein [Candidatus Aminicenantes bacterium]
MKRTVKIFGAGVVVLLITLMGLFPSQRLEGSINGKVVDPQGNALPGVTLTVTGPALQGQMIYVTNETGIFHFSALPPGKNYVLYVEMPGFQNLKRENLLVETGKTIKLFIVLQVSRMEEEVAVIERSPLVDTGASKTSIRISSDLINDAPIFRDYYNIVNFAPGAVPGEDHYYRTSFLSGAAVKDNLYSLDGTVINDPQYMTPMINVNIDLMEEMEIELSGHPVDMPSSGGAYINVVSKSGGNAFQGTFSWEYFNKSMQADLLREEELKAAELTMP